ncbi:Rho GTPase [Microbotryomycetes sp. JL221]|nr:Rho GTPase [Microbotryomycetes sp. JL221]
MPAEAVRRKLVIVGDGACGKTSLLSVFAMGEMPLTYQATVFENYVAELRLDGKPVQLALWDTAGQEEYERLRPLSYSKSHVIVIAFALDAPDSLDNVSAKWIEEVRSLCGSSVPVVLVGCKRDLRDSGGGSGKFVTTEQGQRIALEIGARAYHECSALMNEGVDEVFEKATRLSMLVRDGEARPRKQANNNEPRDEKAGCGCVVC